jgi:hypothetical protein
METQTAKPSVGAPIPLIPPIRVPLPEGALDIPYPHERVLHFEAGLYLDRLLRPLARVSGAIDRALALRLWRLRERSGYKHLGCARFADYAREHLGLAVRTAQQMVRLGKGLGRLPLLDAVLAEGRVTWTGALHVVRVAGKEDEAQWVSLAEELSVRELRQKVDEALASADDAKSGKPIKKVDGVESGAEADDAGFGKPIKNDNGAGREADDDPLQRLSVTCAWSVARLWHAATELCEMVVGGPMAEGEAPEYILAELLSGLRAIPDGAFAPHRPPAPVVDPMGREFRSRRGPRLVARLAEELGSRVLSVKQHRRIAKLLDLMGEDIPERPLDLDESMKALIRARTELELDLARLLRNFRAYGLARHIGFRTFKEYVSERLGISIDRARFLVRLDNRLIRFPQVRRAVRRGEIGTVAALLVCRVADSELTERAWIERAGKRTVERLKKEVEWAEREAGRSYVGSVMPPPPGRLPSDLETVTAELIAARDEAGEASDAAGSTPEQQQGETFAHPVHPGRQVRVDFRLRTSALELWQEVKQRLCWAGGRWVVSDEQVMYEAALAFLLTYMPLWLHAVEHGDPIAVRDRFACIVPGCTNRCGSPHHLRFRSQGGPDEAWNLAHMCHTHHLELLHQLGFIRVHGRAPDDLVFELGIRPDGTAVEIFVNEKRVDGPVNRIPDVTPVPWAATGVAEPEASRVSG